MKRRAGLFLLLLLPDFPAHAQAQVTTIEGAMRSCGAPVTRSALLDQAALLVASQTALQVALSTAGYLYSSANVLRTSDAQTLLGGITGSCVSYRSAREYGLSEQGGSYVLILGTPRLAPGTVLATDLRTEQAVLTATNAARAQGQSCGGTWYPPAPPLQWNSSLAQAAHTYAAWQAERNLTGHVDPTLGTPGDRAAREGWRGNWGENLAYGPASPEEAVKAWIVSPDHCRNLMNPKHLYMGAGVAVNTHSAYGTYWGQLFGY